MNLNIDTKMKLKKIDCMEFIFGKKNSYVVLFVLES